MNKNNNVFIKTLKKLGKKPKKFDKTMIEIGNLPIIYDLSKSTYINKIMLDMHSSIIFIKTNNANINYMLNYINSIKINNIKNMQYPKYIAIVYKNHIIQEWKIIKYNVINNIMQNIQVSPCTLCVDEKFSYVLFNSSIACGLPFFKLCEIIFHTLSVLDNINSITSKSKIKLDFLLFYNFRIISYNALMMYYNSFLLNHYYNLQDGIPDDLSLMKMNNCLIAIINKLIPNQPKIIYKKSNI